MIFRTSTRIFENLQGFSCRCAQEPPKQKVGLCSHVILPCTIHSSAQLPSCCCSCYPAPCAINKTKSNHCGPGDSFVPFPLLILTAPLPTLPPLSLLLSPLSIDPSIHTRRRPAPLRAAGPLLPSSSLPFLPRAVKACATSGCLPFPSFLALVCAFERSRDRSRASPGLFRFSTACKIEGGGKTDIE